MATQNEKPHENQYKQKSYQKHTFNRSNNRQTGIFSPIFWINTLNVAFFCGMQFETATWWLSDFKLCSQYNSKETARFFFPWNLNIISCNMIDSKKIFFSFIHKISFATNNVINLCMCNWMRLFFDDDLWK